MDSPCTSAPTTNDASIISHTISKPADSWRPSLLNLPGKIRNSIYELLFVQKQPIRLRPEIMDAVADSTLKFGVSLLFTCRQIHIEASALVYARNRFLLRIEDEDGYYLDGDEWDYPLEVAGNWLEGLGRNRALLKSLEIRADYLSIGSNLDFSQLFRGGFPYSTPGLRLSFFDPTTRMEPLSVDNCTKYNNIFTALRDKSTVPDDLWTYMRCHSDLHRFLIDTDENCYICIELRSTMSHEEGDERETGSFVGYALSSNGQRLRRMDREQSPDLAKRSDMR